MSRTTRRIRLWDLPLRVFHWSLVLAVGTAIVSGELGGRWMALHGQTGLVVVGLVVFRLVWGLIGSTHARFLRFAPTPRTLKAYLRGRWSGVGHSPLGALAVFALLALLAAQVGTGLFSKDDIDFSGPLFHLVDEAFARRLTGLHQQLANALFALLALHVAAIAFYVALKKDNLVKPMLTGWKDVEETGAESAQHGGPIAFVVALAIAVAAVLAVSAAASPTIIPPPAAAAPKPAW